jgi:CIC family chloride channel protein
MLKEGRPHLETVIKQAKELQVPVHTVLRLGRNVADAVRKTINENAADIVVLGWPGYTNTAGRLFGSVIDSIVDDPPSDCAIVRYRAQRTVRSILVPVGGGPNSRRAVQLAVSMAAQGEDGLATVTLLYITPPGAGQPGLVRAEQAFRESLVGVEYELLEKRVTQGKEIAETILTFSKESETQPAYDLIVIGATNEPLFKNLLVGNISAKVAQEAEVTVIVVKRRSSAFHTLLRQTELEPTQPVNPVGT